MDYLLLENAVDQRSKPVFLEVKMNGTQIAIR